MYKTDLLTGDEPDCFSASAGSLFPTKGSDGGAAPCPLGSQLAFEPAPAKATKPSKGTFCNETIVLRDVAGASLVTAVIELFDAHRKLGRKRQAREVENERQLLSVMLANGLRCSWYRGKALVVYRRKADADEYTKIGKPDWFSGAALDRTAKNLADAGLVELQCGERGTASGYSVTRKLLALALQFGVTPKSLGTSLQREDLVRLKGLKPKPTFDRQTRKLVRHKAKRIYFDPTPDTEEWRDGLAAFHEFVGMQDVTVDAPDDVIRQWVRKLNNEDTHTGARVRQPELFRTSPYRVFNDGHPDSPKFDKGGRLAGAWWLSAPGESRAYIRINGEPTVELDYDACHPRMLYHELDLEPDGKLYAIPEVAALEVRDRLAPDAYRDFVKWLTQVLINGGSRPDLATIPKYIAAPEGIKRRDVAAAIERRHEPISSAFRTRAGLRLMKIEADIALTIITKAMQKGWLALPIHDAFIVGISKIDELRSMMVEEYQTRLGHEPTITHNIYDTKIGLLYH